MKLELTNYLKDIIVEELKHYDNAQFKNIGKSKADKVEKDRSAEEIKVDDKKAECLEAITSFVNEYNTTKLQENYVDMMKKLMEVGKFFNAKKAVVEENLSKYKFRPKIYAFEVAKMFQECACENEKSETYVVPSADKKGDPEQAKKVKEAVLPKSNVKTSLGETEKASGKPAGVKVMKSK